MSTEAGKYRVLHIIQQLTLGGAARALVATSKYSSRTGPYTHEVVSLVPATPDGRQLAESEGVRVYDAPGLEHIRALIEASDIIHINWWNNAQLQKLLREDLPPMRSLVWYHVAGDHSPQLITPSIAEFACINVATNPYTWHENPVFNVMREQGRGDRIRMILDPADLARVAGVEPKPHSGFNVGYIGTVDFYKMHPDFVRMSSRVDIPGVQFLVCGGGIQDRLREQARQLSSEHRFQFLGYVKDIRPVLEQLDVYGYPLCEETYASGELNLQEVMACGIPPVVFPYGGVRRIIRDHFNGLVVNSPDEYVKAIQTLYHNRALRLELGKNARETALKEFGAENAAGDLNAIYGELLRQPKIRHIWGLRTGDPVAMAAPVYSCPEGRGLSDIGAETFCESLGDAGLPFRRSATPDPDDIAGAVEADLTLLGMSSFVHDVGIKPYLVEFRQDRYLWYWSGLLWMTQMEWGHAIHSLIQAVQHGFNDVRVHQLLAFAAGAASNEALRCEAEEKLASFPSAARQQSGRLASALRRQLFSQISEDGSGDAGGDNPDSADVEKLFEAGRWSEASALLTDLWEKHGDSVQIFEGLASCSIETGDLDGAARWLTMATALDDCPPINMFQLSRVQRARGRVSEAAEWARRYENSGSAPVDAFWKFAGQLAFDQSEWKDAVGYFRRAIDTDSRDWESYLFMAHCFRSMGEMQAALDLARFIVDRCPDYRAAQDFIRLNSGVRKEGLSRQPDQNKADDSRLPVGDRDIESAIAATKAMAAEDPPRAGYHFYKLLEKYPTDTRVLETVGIHELQTGRMEAAMGHFGKIVNITPDNENGWTYLAQVYLSRGDIDEVTRCLEKALKLNPSNLDANQILAILHFQAGQYVESAKLYKALIEISPLERDYYTGLRDCFERMGDMDTVVQIEERLKELDKVVSVAKVPAVPSAQETRNQSASPASDASAVREESDILVSVIVSTYNNEAYIRGCLEDLVRQTIFEKCEVIVIDSGSEENEADIVSGFTAQYSNIRYLRTEREPLYDAWNRGIRMARGRYITNANTDDAHRVDALEVLVDALDRDPEAMLAYGDVYWTDQPNDTFDSPSVIREVRYDSYAPAQVMIYCPTGCHPMWRREVFDRIGFFNSEFRIIGDYEFVLRLVEAGLKAIHVPEFLSLFYQNERGLSFHNQGHDREISVLLKRFRDRMPIERLVRVETAGGGAMAVAQSWAAFGTWIARGVRVPWHDEPLHEWDYAIQSLSRALEINPELWAARVNLCFAAGQSGNQALLNRTLPGVPQSIRKTVVECILSRMPLWEPFVYWSPHDPGSESASTATAAHTPEGSAGSGNGELKVPLRWHGPMFNESGFASEAHMFLFSLNQNGIHPAIRNIGYVISDRFLKGMPSDDRQALFRMRDRYASCSGGIVVQTGDTNLLPMVGADYLVGRVMFETERLPRSWMQRCNLMDELWVTGTPQKQAYMASGVPESKIHILNGAVDERLYDPDKCGRMELGTGTTFNFFAIFEWIYRKGWDVLFEAYFREFDADDDVTLLIRTYMSGADRKKMRLRFDAEAARIATKIGKPVSKLPRYRLLEEMIPVSEFGAFYNSVDCVVSPSRGEGWGRPQQEAMLMGLPVIATGWGGTMEFMSPETNYLIDYKLQPVRGVEAVYWDYRESRWAEPDVEHLAHLMRHVVVNRDEARQTGARARQHILNNFNRQKVTQQLIDHLARIQDRITRAVPARPLHVPEPLHAAAHEAGSPARPIQMALEGSFLDFGSLSKVNRELSSALGKRESIKLARVPVDGSGGKSTAKASLHGLDVHSLKRNIPPRTRVVVRHSWPPVWKKPSHGRLVMMQPWEFGRVPLQWAREVNSDDVAELWTYTRAVADAYIDSGTDPRKIRVVPLGVDTARYTPDGPALELDTRKSVRFLFVGGTIHRKGPDILLETYLRTFTSQDDVCLVIKDFGGDSVYQGQTLEEAIRKAQLDPLAPEILYLNEEMSEDDMISLYRSCHCLVHPYRGEGFGLPVLEAMACGLPVMVTAGGATDDFVPDDCSWKIPARRQMIGRVVSDITLGGDGWLLEPDASSLSASLREAYGCPDKVKEMGSRAAAHAHEHCSWDRTAAQVEAAVHEIIDREESLREAGVSAPPAIELPPVARVGGLATAGKLFEAGRMIESWNEAVKAISVRPFHPEAWLHMALVAERTGQFSIASECAARAYKMAPGHRDIKSTASRLKKSGKKKSIASTEKPACHGDLRLPDENPLLSLCLITRNEEENLERCLASASGIADQIIVVDTGSTDRTVEIAREYGATVLEIEWAEDFSLARNKALELATGQWVLVLDADEELPEASKSVLLADLHRDQAMAYRLPIVDIGHEEDGHNYVPRLFRNAPGLFYIGRIHEQVFSSVEVRRREWGLQNSFSEAVIHHYGYSEEMTRDRDKINRNLKLLELALEDLPDDPNLLMNAGMELCRAGNPKCGMRYYEKALLAVERMPADEVTPELRDSLLHQIVTYLIKTRDYGELLDLMNSRFVQSGRITASVHFMTGIAQMESGLIRDAEQSFRQCIAKRNERTYSVSHPEVHRGGPHHCLGMCLEKAGHPEQAMAEFGRALKLSPDSPGIRNDFMRICRDNGLALKAIEFLNSQMHEDGDSLVLWQTGALICLENESLHGFGLEWTSEAAKYFPKDEALTDARVRLMLECGQLDALNQLFSQGYQGDIDPNILSGLVWARLMSGSASIPTVPAQNESTVSHLMLQWYRKWVDRGFESLIRALNDRVDKLDNYYPSAARVLHQVMAEIA